MNPFAHTTIVVPVDLSDASIYALTFARQLADAPNNVAAIHVGLPLTAVEPYGYLLDDTMRRRDLEILVRERYKAFIEEGGRLVVRYGDPSDTIATYAQELDAGLILMPSHGRTGLAHMLIGSVAEHVVRHARCPVLILRGMSERPRQETCKVAAMSEEVLTEPVP
jgi:nucleotide-binding universal stress UspA family protein